MSAVVERDHALYIVFGSWIKARRFAYDQNAEIGQDVIHPNDQRAKEILAGGFPRRIVFVREEGYRISDGTAAYWRSLTEAARAANDDNEFVTEIMHV